jgi:hypothetical protein
MLFCVKVLCAVDLNIKTFARKKLRAPLKTQLQLHTEAPASVSI